MEIDDGTRNEPVTTAVENLKPESKAKSARDKAQVTNTIAYGIIDAEAAARKEKTARLRALRKKKEEDVAPLPDESSTGAKRKRTAPKKRKT